MASNIHVSTASRTNLMSQLNTDIGTSALIRIYDGTQPAGPDTAITSQVLLATLTGNAGGFGSASAGVLTASAITSATAVGTSTATWARILTSGGTARVDCSVGMSGTDIVLNNTSIATGQTVSISSLTLTALDA